MSLQMAIPGSMVSIGDGGVLGQRANMHVSFPPKAKVKDENIKRFHWSFVFSPSLEEHFFVHPFNFPHLA